MRFPFPGDEPAVGDAYLDQAEENPPITSDPVAAAVEPETVLPLLALVPVTEATDSSRDAVLQEPSESSHEKNQATVPQEEESIFEAPLAPQLPRPQPRRKVIAFPSPMYTNGAVAHRLADPVSPHQLRILDVPEQLEAVQATPFLDGLFPSASVAAARPPSTPELPVLPASGWKRIQAGVLDAALVALGIAAFVAAAYRFLPPLEPTKSTAAGAIAVATLLWSAYQYLFVVYGGATPGMKAAKLHVRTFKGAPAKIQQRRLRVLSEYLSVFSLGMGLLWCFVDVDSLCWHDRMSHTFLTSSSN
jgi:uncharacterized RDD family membrane protein YckC